MTPPPRKRYCPECGHPHNCLAEHAPPPASPPPPFRLPLSPSPTPSAGDSGDPVRIGAAGLLTAREVADRLGISRTTVYVLVREGHLKAYKLKDRLTRFSEPEVVEYLRTHGTAAA